MKGRVHYVSPKGCAEMVAEAIAREIKIVKEPLLPASVSYTHLTLPTTPYV